MLLTRLGDSLGENYPLARSAQEGKKTVFFLLTNTVQYRRGLPTQTRATRNFTPENHECGTNDKRQRIEAGATAAG